MKANFIIPAINIGGGVREVFNLADEIKKNNVHAEIITLWRGMHQMSTSLPVQELTRVPASRLWAIFTFPFVFLRYALFLIKSRSHLFGVEFFIFTHYLTVPFYFFVKRRQRVFFIQDLEWRFLGNGVISRFLKTILIFCFRRGVVISANSYLAKELQALGVLVHYNLSIWADSEFKCENNENMQRDFDFVMVLRRGVAKRLDLYIQFIELCSKNPDIKLIVITPHDELASLIRDSVAEVLVRPSIHEMRAVYARSKIFVMLSEHEGFGLPPLEAMGCACVPVCRDSGGIHAYMYGNGLDALVLPLDMPLDEVYRFCTNLLANPAQLRTCSVAAVARFDEGVEKARTRRVVIEKFISEMQNVLSAEKLKY